MVVAYDEATKNVLFFRQENSEDFPDWREISLGKGSVRLEDQFQFIFFWRCLVIFPLNSREFYCKYNLAYVFY